MARRGTSTASSRSCSSLVPSFSAAPRGGGLGKPHETGELPALTGSRFQSPQLPNDPRPSSGLLLQVDEQLGRSGA